jgi:hypothetical protein
MTTFPEEIPYFCRVCKRIEKAAFRGNMDDGAESIALYNVHNHTITYAAAVALANGNADESFWNSVKTQIALETKVRTMLAGTDANITGGAKNDSTFNTNP